MIHELAVGLLLTAATALIGMFTFELIAVLRY